MKFLPGLLAFALTLASLQAQSVRYEVPAEAWKADLGSHRVIVKVAQPAEAVRAHLPWRRRDPHPETKGILVTTASGERITNCLAPGIAPEAGDVVFEAKSAGEYRIYFLPGDPGHGSFPQAHYLPPQATAAAAWKERAGVGDGEQWRRLPEAPVVRWEARTEHDRFTAMETIATATEGAAWLERAGPGRFFVFPEVRENSVRMTDHLPEVWLKRGAAPEFQARPNEYFVFQLGIWAARGDLNDLQVHFSDLTSERGTRIPAAALHCLQTSGTDWRARPFAHAIGVANGNVQALWCALDLGKDFPLGQYSGSAEVTAIGEPAQRVPLHFTVTGAPLEDHGDSDPGRLTKLRWLDSRIAQDDTPTRPFTALKVSGRTIHLAGRSVQLAECGLPERITSYFHPGVTRIVDQPTEILSAPMRFVAELADGSVLPLAASGFRFEQVDDGVAEWSAQLRGGEIALDIHGRLEFDGHMEYRCALRAGKPLEVRDLRLEIRRTTATTPLILGLGNYGGAAPAKLDWKWDVEHRNQDAVWLGTVNAGLRVQLRAENYVRPYVNIHYTRQPLKSPPSWDNAGRGGMRFAGGMDSSLLTCYSGARTLAPEAPLHFDFDLSVTPFHPLDTAAQWHDRYYQTGGVTAPAKIRESGANVVNIHQGNALNPYINYPFLTAAKLRAYTTEAHAAGLRVKYYYTVRELTNWTPELFAADAFAGELIAPGRGEGHAWCEHLGGNYWQAWAEPSTNDASILTTSLSRWDNLYLEGLQWLVDQTGCDGLYLDDISYDRSVTERARKILDRSPQVQGRGGGLIDLHSWNEAQDARAGHASCALLFMDSLPFVDRLWFGEGHPYDGPPEQTLAAISGIPFGLMGEMLQGGGNPWLGLTFGMTGRLGWGGKPAGIWKLWDDFGAAGSDFIGWWDPSAPVKAAEPEVKVTLWRRAGRTLLAVGNFGDKPVHAHLAIDWAALGLDPAKAALYAPEIEGFQPELLIPGGAPLDLAPKRGLALWLDETPRAKPIVTAFQFEKAKVLFEDRFTPAVKAGWATVVNAKVSNPIQYDGSGAVFLAPANVHAWMARELPPGVRAVSAQIRQDSGDKGQQWGPGFAITWADGKFLKVNRRDDGRFGLSINGDERVTGQCDRELPVTLSITLDAQHVRVLASGEGAFQQEQELARLPRGDFPGDPGQLRLGKMANSLQPVDYATAGEMGWSRCDWVRVFGP